MNLNELRNQAYRNAVVHGWHEENLSDEHFLCLVMSELMEAVNADRKGKRALRKIFEATCKIYLPYSRWNIRSEQMRRSQNFVLDYASRLHHSHLDV